MLWVLAVPVWPALTDTAATTDDSAVTATAAAFVSDGLLISASRIKTLSADLPQRVDVIDARALDRAVGGSVADVLKMNANVDVAQYPGLSGVGLRGMVPDLSAYSKSTALLIDGRPAGTANVSALPLEGVERIEILKGAASALYGAEAMGGVINIVTKDHSDRPLSSRLAVAAGSFGAWRARFDSGGRLNDRLDLDLGASMDARSGDVQTGDHGTLPHSAYRMDELSLRLGWRLAPGWRLDARVDGSFGDSDLTEDVASPYAVPDPGHLESARYGASLALSGGLLGTDLSLLGYASRDQSVGQLYAGTAEGVRRYYPAYGGDDLTIGGQALDVLRWRGQSLAIGLSHSQLFDSRQARSAPTPPGFSDDAPIAPYSPDSSQITDALFAQAELAALDRRITGNLGLRLDMLGTELRRTAYRDDIIPAYVGHSQFSPSAGLQLRPWDGLRLHGSAGLAFAPPEASKLSLDALIYGTRYIGNAALAPVTSRTADLGIGLERARWGFRSDLSWFWTDLEGDIATRPVEGAPIPTYTYVNLPGTSQIQGLELECSEDLGVLAGAAYSLRVFGNMTQLFRSRAAQSPPGDARPINRLNVAESKAVVGVDFDDRKGFLLGLNGRYRGAVLDLDFDAPLYPYPEISYPAFWVYEIHSALALGQGRLLRVSVSNVGDVYYYEKKGYPQPGRAYQMGFEQSF